MNGIKKDRIFSEFHEEISRFVFDENVTDVFDDMIQRSVPGYQAAVNMVRVFAEHYAQEGSNMYDLGASLGASTFALSEGCTAADCTIFAIDNSPAMIEQLKSRIEVNQLKVKIIPVLDNMENAIIENASIVVLNYTLQFLDPSLRCKLIQNIYDGLCDGGVLILSEKITFEDTVENDFQIDMHHHFKALQGYSHLEISQKRKSIEHVLIPETLQTHFARLEKAGFARSYLWLQCFNFVSLAAFKS